MTIIIAIFALFLCVASLWGIVAPKRMVDTVIKAWERPSGIWLAIGIRVVLGIAFILAAADTRYPIIFTVLGYAMLVAAVSIPIIGKERLTRIVQWFTKRPDIFVRSVLVLSLAFGLFLLYAVV